MYHHLQHSRNTDSDSDEEEEEDHPITWATVSVLPTIPTTTITTTTTTSASTLPKHNTISTESHPIITPRPFRKQKRIISSNQHLPIDQTTLKTIRLLAMRLSGKERDSHHITPPTARPTTTIVAKSGSMSLPPRLLPSNATTTAPISRTLSTHSSKPFISNTSTSASTTSKRPFIPSPQRQDSLSTTTIRPQEKKKMTFKKDEDDYFGTDDIEFEQMVCSQSDIIEAEILRSSNSSSQIVVSKRGGSGKETSLSRSSITKSVPISMIPPRNHITPSIPLPPQHRPIQRRKPIPPVPAKGHTFAFNAPAPAPIIIKSRPALAPIPSAAAVVSVIGKSSASTTAIERAEAKERIEALARKELEGLLDEVWTDDEELSLL